MPILDAVCLTALFTAGCGGGVPPVAGHRANDGREPLQEWIDEAGVAADDGGLIVSAREETSGGQPALTFTMRNVGTAPIHMKQMDLPWGHESTISTVGVTPDGRVMGFPMFFADPGPSNSTVVVEPGQMLSGTRELASDSVTSELSRNDVLVLWRYRLPGVASKGSSTGVVVFHKRAG